MNQSRKILEMSLIGLFGLILTACQKENLLGENQMTLKSGEVIEASALQPSTGDLTDYLLGLVENIETLLSYGILDEGNANALESKIENAGKSFDKGNTFAFDGQLNAFINQIEAFINRDSVNFAGPGQILINKAKTAMILADGSFVDPRDGYTYPVVLIGRQLWMAENLRATKYTDGTDIPIAYTNSEWSSLTTGAYCWYLNDYDNFGINFGSLYNWYAVETGMLCPDGWHVPSNYDWMTLTSTLGGDNVAGGKLKAIGTVAGGDGLWISPNTGATNESGFTGLPGGSRTPGGMFYSARVYGNWWSSSPMNQVASYTLFLMYNNSRATRAAYTNNHGLSVRCVRY